MRKGKMMGKIFGVALVFVMLTSTLGGLVWAREGDIVGAGYVGVSVEQAKEMVDSDPDVAGMDVRTEDQYETGHTANAELVPLSELEGSTEGLDEDLTRCPSIGDQLEQGCSSADSQTSTTSASSSSLSSEIDAVLDSNKPVFLFFYADWCHFCQQQTPIIDGLEQEYAEEIVFIRVNSEDNPQAMQEFGVTGFPAMFLIIEKGENGEYVYQESGGFTEKETLKASFDYVIANGSLPEDSDLPQSHPSFQFNQANRTDFAEDAIDMLVNNFSISNAKVSEVIHLLRTSYYVPVSFIEATGDQRVTISIENGTVQDVIKNIMAQSPEYKWTEVNGRLIVYPDSPKYETVEILGEDPLGCCVRSITYDNQQSLGCGFGLSGVRIGYDITGVTTCPGQSCQGRWLTESVTRDHGCPMPKEVETGHGCLLRAGNTFGACTDTYGMCYFFWEFPAEGCVETLTQILYVDGRAVERCVIKFVFTHGASGTVTRSCTELADPEMCTECDEDDGWYCKDIDTHEYRDYYCDKGGCKYQVTQTKDCKKDEICEKTASGAICKEKDEEDDGHGDTPDDNYDVSTPQYSCSTSSDIETRSNVAVMSKGNYISASKLLESFFEPVTFIHFNFLPSLTVDDYPVLIVPTGGLFGLDSSPTFKSNLARYVENGGTLIVFSQQHGYEYNALPGGEVSGYGWLEDQSCQYSSVYIDTYHPILSGQDSVTLDVVVDGYFTKWHENATVLLSRTKNGMPAMLMYKYGNGTVIASTIYEDWAYTHNQATQDGKNLIRDMIAWAKNPVEIPEYGASDTVDIPVDVFNVHLPIPEVEYPQYALGEVVSIPIEITNYSDNQTSDKVIFSVFDPDYEVEDIDVPVSIPPGETTTVDFTYETTESSKTGIYYVLYSVYAGETMIGGGFGTGFGLGVDISELSTYKLNFTLRDPDKNIVQEETTTITVPAGEIQAAHFNYANPSKLGIWSLEYEILDYSDTLLESGVERFAVSKYAENPDGWVYQGEDISFSITTPAERYPIGSDVPFTIHIWNKGDTDRSISCQGSGVDETILVPAQGEASFLHIMENVNSSWIRFTVGFYDEDNNYLGSIMKGMWGFYPSININVEADKQEYVKGENIFILLSLENKQSVSHDVTVIVRALDPDNAKIFEESFDTTIAAGASGERTLEFSLSTIYGIYQVTAEAYEDGNKVGSGSTYFEVRKDYMVRVAFDHPDNKYRARESMGIDVEAINVGSAPWSSTVDISIPVLGFNDFVDFTVDPGQTERVSYNLRIPEDITAGKHEVILTIEFDGSAEEHYFFIPQSELVLSIDKTSYNAGENLSIDLSNIGGVDTTGNCSVRFYDSYRFIIYEGESQESVQAGGNKTLEFMIPEQSVSGKYYLIAWCKDLNTDNTTRLSKSCTVEGLEASVTSITDKKTYFTDEDISISTNVTNLDGEIVNGTLNLKIFSRSGLPGSMLADSAGKEFFLVYTDNLDDGSDSAVFITSDVDTSGVVEIPGIGFSQPFTVVADNIATVNIPSSAEVSGSDNIEDKGIYLLAEDDVTVYFLNPSTPVYTNDAYLALPLDILGTEYVILAYQGAYFTEGPSEIVIVAPYDDTVVTITPSVTIEPLDAGVPYTITLQRFQTYTLQSDSPLEDLTGTIIESSQPVAVFAGVRCADIPVEYGYCDHIVEQMTPVATWGKEFDTFPFMPRLNGRGDFLRILASTDDTVVIVNSSVIGTIDRGEFLEITVTEPLEISATEPVLVAQYLTGEDYEGRTGDPFECLIPPTEQFLSKYTFVTPTGYAENYVNVVASTSSLSDLLLDGSPVDAGVFSPFGSRGLSAGTITLSEGSHTMLGSAPFGIYVYGYDQYVSYGYLGGLSLKALKKHLIWEETIPIDISALEVKNIVTNIDIPTEMPDITGKLDLLATLYTSASQIIGQSEGYSFFITGEDTSFTMETDKEVYKPNEAITIYGEVQNNAEVANDYSLSIKKDGEEIFSDSFTLDPGESHGFTTGTSSENSFTLEGTVDEITIADFITIEYPNVDVTIIAPDIVGLADFDVGILVENIASVDCDINVTMVDEAWDVLIPAGESRLMETTRSITEDTTLDVIISGDVEKTVQKNIIMGEDARIEITPQNIYLEGIVEIPFTVENTGVLDTEFEATFSISSPEEQTIIRTLFIPQGVSIADTLSFNLTRGKHLLTYRSPFKEGTMEICVGMPEFVVTELPSNLNLTLGQEVTWTFKVGNIGGAEGEAHLYLMLPDWEETKSTWIMPGQEEEISFDFTVADDLEEKEYKAIYELDGVRDEFTFFVQGAKVIVDASLDKPLYEEGETAILTLNIANDCTFDLSLYARAQLHEYEDIQLFELTDSESLQFNIPVTFNDNKLFYGIYMEPGRALYLNALYVHQRQIITLYTDKQVYLIGETATIFVETAESGTLNIVAPGYSTELEIEGSTTLTFTVPELRSGTYYIEYTFDGFSSSYPFDVIGYSARITEFSLDKQSYKSGEIMDMKADVEANRDFAGLFKGSIYDPEENLIEEFEIPRTFVRGENEIDTIRTLLTETSGIHAVVYAIYADLSGHSLVLLASGAEYFDGISGNTPPVADAGPDQTVCVVPPATTAMVTLDGSGSYDPDGDPLTYNWTWDGNTAYGINPIVELPLGTTIITLVVNDGKADSEPDTVNIIVNQPPNQPSNPSPANHATGVSINADLSWSGGDLDAGDTVTYDVYFGTSETPPLEETIGPYPATQISITCDSRTLSYNTKYYWQIVARDNHGATTEGPVWEFTTSLLGDANRDGVVNTGDITKVKRIYFGIDSPTDRADVNGDGKIDTGDITAIRLIYFS